jgi:hypothetical protein
MRFGLFKEVHGYSSNANRIEADLLKRIKRE